MRAYYNARQSAQRNQFGCDCVTALVKALFAPLEHSETETREGGKRTVLYVPQPQRTKKDVSE